MKKTVLLFILFISLCTYSYAQKKPKLISLLTNEKKNNADITHCQGESFGFGLEIDGRDDNESYFWTYNDGSSTINLTNRDHELWIFNSKVSDNGVYELTVKKTDTEEILFTVEFIVHVFPPIITIEPQDITLYNLNESNSHTFNFNQTVSPFVLEGLDPDLFGVDYFITPINVLGTSSTNKLNNTYTTESSILEIFAKIYYKNSTNLCFSTSNFNIIIDNVPQPSQPSDYSLCDDEINGGDTDGFYNNFLLSTKDIEILGDLRPNDYNLSYHTTLTGAKTSSTTDVINKNIPFRNTQINQQNIYIRLEHIQNGYAFISGESSPNLEPFKLIVNPLPNVTSITELTQCDVDSDLSSLINLTLSEINITNNDNVTFKYFTSENDALNDTNEIIIPEKHQVINNDVFWIKVTSSQGCSRISQLNITVFIDNNIINYNNIIEKCDDISETNTNIYDGITSFNFVSNINNIKNNFPISLQPDLRILLFENENDRDTVTNNISDITDYTNSNIPAYTKQNIYFKVINTTNNKCNGIGSFSILVHENPMFTVNSPQVICLNMTNSINIEIENPKNIYSYEWTKNNEDNIILSTNSTLTVTSPGKYYITATNNTTQCQYTKTISVIESEDPIFNSEHVFIIDDNENNSISIDSNIGIGDYEFALFNEDETEIIRDYQDEPIFNNLEGGIYTIAIQDKNNCGIATLQVSIIEFPKFLTPNNDGYNDTWTLKGANLKFYSNSFMYIFDRFGKQLAEIPIDNEGWDGTFNGKLLPPNDYWYSIQLVDKDGNIRNKKGYFSLIRN